MEQEDKVVQPIFCRVGGKTPIIQDILNVIPQHTTYVEAFAGGASVFWNKPKVKQNVLNDLDAEIIDGYKALKKASTNPTDYPFIDDKNEATRKDKMNEFISKDYKDPTTRVMKTIYKTCNTYGASGKGKILKPRHQKTKLNLVPYFINKIKKNVTITSQDYKAVLKKYDKPSTFFFLDPPYEKSEGLYKNPYIDYEEMANLLKKLKGKFLLTINDSPEIRKVFKDFHMYPIKVKSQSRGQSNFKEVRDELFITNYEVNKAGTGVETDRFFDEEDDENKIVSIPEFQSVKVELPTYMYKELPDFANGNAPKYRYRLVNPITDTRNIASRQQEKSVDIKRKPIAQPFTNWEESDKLPKLGEFSPKDQAKIKEYYNQVKANEKKDRDQIADQPADNASRGFPVTMYKTADRLGFSKTNEKVYQRRQAVEKPPKAPKPPSEKKPRGRPKKQPKQVTIVNPDITTEDGEDPFAEPFAPLTEDNVSSRASSKKGSKSSKQSVKSESAISIASSGDISGIDPNEYLANLEKKYGRGVKNNISTNNNKMNSWVQYVKDYAAKNGMKYNEALKDPAVKAGYKKGKGVCMGCPKGCAGCMSMGKGLVSDVKSAVKSASKKVGLGIIDEAAAAGYADQVLIADAYNQTQLGSNAHKRYISL